MLNSMTGFARQTTETESGTLTCELRTVNHRYLDIAFRLPEELRPRELELRNRLAATLSRGKVECSVHLRRGAAGHGELQIDEARVAQIADKAAVIARALDNAGTVDPLDVLRWPGVAIEPAIDAEPLYADTAGLMDRAIAALAEMRASEGERIAAMLETRLDEVLQIAAGVQARMPAVLESVRRKQKERIDKLDVAADPARLETELALIAQKLDVAEELDRLESHVSEVRTALASDEPVGRRLDFLMQELNREANTLGSKSADAETTRAAVDLKVLVEQMREQVQNIE